MRHRTKSGDMVLDIIVRHTPWLSLVWKTGPKIFIDSEVFVVNRGDLPFIVTDPQTIARKGMAISIEFLVDTSDFLCA